MSRWDLTDLAEEVIDFRNERDWAQFHRPKELAAGLSIEASELQELFLWRESEYASDVKTDPDLMAQIGEEVADVAVYLLTLASDLDLDLESAIRDKLAKNAVRYPADEYRGRSDKAPH